MKYSPFVENDRQIFIDNITYNHIKQIKDFDIEEGYSVEFKENYDKEVQKKISKIITSFANCDGGWIIIGINDKTKEIIDLQKPTTEIELQIANKISPNISPVLPKFRAKFIENPNNKGYGVIVICVEEGLCPPYVTNGTIYMRNSSSSEPIKPERSTIDYLYKKRDNLSALTLKTIYNNKLFNDLKLSKYNYTNATSIIELWKSNITKNINQLTSITFKIKFDLPKDNCCNESKKFISTELKKISETFSSQIPKEILSFNEYKNVDDFFKKEFEELAYYTKLFNPDVEIDKLLDVGNLQIQINKMPLENSWDYFGKEQEVNKCKHLLNLLPLIKKYFEAKKSLSNLINTFRICLVISNEGYKYDEDIIVSLYFPKESFFDIKKEIFLGINNIEFNETILNMFKWQDLSFIELYDNYPPTISVTPPLKFSMFSSNHILDYEDPQYLLNVQKNQLDQLAAYSIYDEDDSKLIKIHFNKLLPHTNMYFPSPFIVNGDLKKLKYSIKSKYSNMIIEGELNI